MVVFLLLFTAALVIPGSADADERMVVGEYFSRSDCPDCHKANVRMADVYYEGDHEFIYVTLIVNKNDLADERMDRYQPVGRSYPTVEFDGGYLEEVGLATIQEYSDDVIDCEDRNIPELTLELEMHPLGDDSIRVKVRVRLDESEDAFGVNVIAYVVEPLSRYKDSSNYRYRFGFLDKAIDADPRLEPGHWWTNETVWVGSEHNDTNGNDFGDISYDNVNIVCAVFLNESGNSRHSLQGAIAVPPEVEILTVPGNVTGQLELAVDATGNATRNRSIESVRFRVDGGSWTDINGTDGHYSTVWNSTDVDNGTHEIEFRVEDDYGTSIRESIAVNVSNNDFSPPTINFILPEGATINGTVEVVINASDENEIVVTLSIDKNEPLVLTGNGTYTFILNTSMLNEGVHKFEAIVSDGSFTVSRHRELIVDNDRDPDFGPIMMTWTFNDDYPISADGNVSGNITFTVYVYDNEEIDDYIVTVEGAIFIGELMRSSEENGTVWSVLNATVNTMVLEDGLHGFTLRVNDSSGQTIESVIWLVGVDNTRPTSVTPTLEWDHGWHLEWSKPPDTDIIGYAVYRMDDDVDPLSKGNYTAWSNITEITITGFPNVNYFAVVAVDDAGNPSDPMPIMVGSSPQIEVDIQTERTSDENDRRTVIVTVTNDGDYTAKGLSLLVEMGNETLFDYDINDLGPRSNRSYTFEWNVSGPVLGNATVTFEGYDITSSTPVTIGSEKDDGFDPVPTVVVGSMVIVFIALLMLSLRIIGFDKKIGWK